MKYWPKSLAGQLIAGLLLVMVAANAVSFIAFMDERRLAVHEASRFQFLSRIASMVRVLESVPPATRSEVAERASGRLLQFSVTPESAVKDHMHVFPTKMISRNLQRMLDIGRRDVRIGGIDGPDDLWRWGPWRRKHHDEDRDYDDDDDDDDDDHYKRRRWRSLDQERDWDRDDGMMISVRLADGGWLNTRTLVPPIAPGWAAASVTAMVVTALALVLLIVLLVRRTTRPLANLAEAAEGVGRGEAFSPVPEKGPKDVRETIAAFNRMQDRQQRFIADRTRMLAAISHDLRTPITSLRIRAEFIEDTELQAKILATLDEMQAMAEATLAFVREDATEERFVETDLGALAESVAADAADIGSDVTFSAADDRRVVVSCRPNALRRALRNVVDNAVAYGESVAVSIATEESAAAIVVEDEGPGIPDADLERIFEPFVRLEESRNRETGGIGLGMAITRTIMRAHGGDVEVANRAEGGLRVVLRLPVERS